MNGKYNLAMAGQACPLHNPHQQIKCASPAEAANA
jgi:hypothetical protein